MPHSFPTRCSSDLLVGFNPVQRDVTAAITLVIQGGPDPQPFAHLILAVEADRGVADTVGRQWRRAQVAAHGEVDVGLRQGVHHVGTKLERSEEHTSELQSLMRISYAVFCLKKKRKST